MLEKNVFAVITAAGSGTRLGYPQPKALVPLGEKTLVERAVETFLQHPQVAGIVVTAPAESAVFTQFEKLFEGASKVLVVRGGATRQESVYRGVLALRELAENLGVEAQLAEGKVLIHDAARCLAPLSVISEVAENIGESAAAVVPVVPVVDTLNTVVYQNGEWAGETVDRSKMRAIQTPQGFWYKTIIAAHEKAQETDGEFTDDASLMQLMDEQVRFVPGSEYSLKITTPFDLQVATALLPHIGA